MRSTRAGVNKSIVFAEVGNKVTVVEASIAAPFVALRRPSKEGWLEPLLTNVGFNLKLALRA